MIIFKTLRNPQPIEKVVDNILLKKDVGRKDIPIQQMRKKAHQAKITGSIAYNAKFHTLDTISVFILSTSNDKEPGHRHLSWEATW